MHLAVSRRAGEKELVMNKKVSGKRTRRSHGAALMTALNLVSMLLPSILRSTWRSSECSAVRQFHLCLLR